MIEPRHHQHHPEPVHLQQATHHRAPERRYTSSSSAVAVHTIQLKHRLVGNTRCAALTSQRECWRPSSGRRSVGIPIPILIPTLSPHLASGRWTLVESRLVSRSQPVHALGSLCCGDHQRLTECAVSCHVSSVDVLLHLRPTAPPKQLLAQCVQYMRRLECTNVYRTCAARSADSAAGYDAPMRDWGVCSF